MKIGIDIGGLSVFDKIKEAAGEFALRSALVAGAKVIRDQAQANINGSAPNPHNITGTMRRNVIMKHVPEDSNEYTRQTYLVTVRTGKHNKEGDAYYWKWVEKGHDYVAPFKHRLSFQTIPEWRAINKLENGDSRTPPHPFMRPAAEMKHGAALEAFKERFAQRIGEALR